MLVLSWILLAFFVSNLQSNNLVVHMKASVCPQIISREEWGARPPKSRSNLTLPLPYWVIHHTSVPGQCLTKEECIKAVRSIQNFHMDTRGWNDIGYNFLIGGDNNIYEGRGWNTVGAHAKFANHISLGFAFIGDFMKTLPKKSTMNLGQTLLACGVELKKVVSNYILRGHRDMNETTTCPGDMFYKEIQTWPHYH